MPDYTHIYFTGRGIAGRIRVRCSTMKNENYYQSEVFAGACRLFHRA